MANVQDANLISADVSGSSGGIEISHHGADAPATVTLTDNASANSLVSFAHRGSALTLTALHNFSTLGGDIFVAAPDSNLIYSGSGISGTSILLAANGNLTVASPISAAYGGDLGLSAGSVLDINSMVQAGNLTLSAPTVNIVSGHVDVFGGGTPS